jgi:aminomethyltransferase
MSPITLKTTALNSVHRELGAKMVDFGGWDMPLHYGSQLAEHLAVRQSVGMFDVSHMCIVDITGNDAKNWLRHLLANDVARLATPGRALYSCMLNPTGGIIDDLIVYVNADGSYRMVINAGTTDKDLTWMQQHLAPYQVSLLPRRDLAMIALQGPLATEKLWQAAPGLQALTSYLKPFHSIHWQDWFVARTGYTGEDGFEIMLPASAAATLWRQLYALGVQPTGLGARDTLRLEAGMNLYGQDMDDTTSPLDSGLAWTVDLKDSSRQFIGRTALESHKPNYRLAGLLLLDKGVLRAHQPVDTEAGQGEITSGSFSPTLQRSIALARLPSAIADGTIVQVMVRNKPLAAKVVSYPFVRHGRSLLPLLPTSQEP